MHWIPRRWTLAGVLLAMMLTMSPVAMAQVATTQVADTIYRADGSTATGTVVISWPEFTTATGQDVPAGSTSATIGAGGALNVQLAPNAGSNPMGSYYTVVYHLDDGSHSTQYWVVPASGTPVKVSAISSMVMPLSVAQQTVNKSYVDTAIAKAVSGVSPTDSAAPYVLTTGDTMTGPLVLPGDPTASTQAADKHYVDTSVQQVAAGVGQKVSLLPQATQVVAQPTGTQLEVNNLNGVEYASQYANVNGNSAIANAVASSDCASGCEVKVEDSYHTNEVFNPSTWNNQTHVVDARQGGRYEAYANPGSVFTPGQVAGQTINFVETQNPGVSGQTVLTQLPNTLALNVSAEAMAGGSNLFPQHIEGVPYFKNNYAVEQMVGAYHTMGQHLGLEQTVSCFGVGDCLMGSQTLLASGGFRDEADEGAHPYDLVYSEDPRVFAGSCSSGCSTGSTSVGIAVSSAAQTQGEGRYLLDKSPAKVISTGSLIGGGTTANYPIATFSGTSFPVSVFFATAQTAPSQANNIAPGTVTLAIAGSGVAAGYATNTVAAPATTGIACVTDLEPPGSSLPHNYEMAPYTVVDGTHLQMSLNKVHAAGSTVAIGGLCGYGLEQTVDTQNGIRQVFPVIGSYSATGLYYGGGLTPIVGNMGQTSGYINLLSTIATISRTNNVVTVTATGNLAANVDGLTMTIAGVTDSSYNGSFKVTTISSTSLTYTQNGPDSTSAGGTVSLLTGGYVLYPMAEVLGVMNPATKLIDGQLTLAPNTVAWAAGDPVEEPHYYQERVGADMELVSQTTPRDTVSHSAGIAYDGMNSNGLIGWQINNDTPASNYLGNGGTYAPPNTAFNVTGIWRDMMQMNPGEQAVFSIGCKLRGCNRWDSGYNLFELNSNASIDTISYQPTTSDIGIFLRGSSYIFTPQAFTAGAIDVQFLHADNISGPVSGDSITSGAVAAAFLPKLGASGSAHAAGIAPDPGTTPGTTRFLREDGTWSSPVANATGLAPGATADYNFLQGSGTTVTDNSGNGNDGSFAAGANAPTWVSTGLKFDYVAGAPQGVSLPATLNSTKTILIVAYTNPLEATSPTYPPYSTLVTSSLGVGGLNFLNQGIQPSGVFIASTFSPSIFANGFSPTYVPDTLSGLHCEAMSVGTGGSDKDHLYVDGNEVASYYAQGSSFGSQTSGNLFLGSSNVGAWSTGGFEGTFYRAMFFSTELTADQVSSTCAGMKAEVASRGVALTPQPIRLSTAAIEGIGDSITAGVGTTAPYLGQLNLTNQPAYAITNWGISNQELIAMAGSEPNRVAQRCASSAGPVIASVFAGTNDFFYLDPGAASVMSSLASEIQTLKAAGCKVFVITMLSRVGNTQSGAHTLDSQKNAYDTLMLEQAKSLGADGVIDAAANPLLGADGAYSNGTYFNTDETHPTNTGQALIAAAYSNVLNYYFGYNEMNPHVVSTLNYAMTAGDGAISLAGLTGAGTLTLPDCTGQSGATYRINNPQSAFAVSIAPLNANQLINGLSSVTVPANATMILRDTPNPKTVSGCHWEM